MRSSAPHRGFQIRGRSSPGPMLVFGMLVLAATGCHPLRYDPAVRVSIGDANPNSRWHANLAPPSALDGAMQINGSASMSPSLDGLGANITLEMANATPGGVHPWEARRGQCGEGMDNGVFGSRDEYQPLKVDSNGRANGVASVSMTPYGTGRYSVLVRASAANPEAILLCGNLAVTR